MVDLGYSEEVCLRSEGELRETVEVSFYQHISKLIYLEICELLVLFDNQFQNAYAIFITFYQY